MSDVDLAALHDAYAADYDGQVAAYDCHVAELLFGLTYEFVCPGERLLDVGIGSGLSSELFAKAGLEVRGMDFSPAMLNICAAKGFAAGLRRHDLRETPWPYNRGEFDHVISCGVFHFLGELDAVFAEAARVLRDGGVFAFTTRAPDPDWPADALQRESAGSFDVFSHEPVGIDSLLCAHDFARSKSQRCYVGDDLFILWVAKRRARQ